MVAIEEWKDEVERGFYVKMAENTLIPYLNLPDKYIKTHQIQGAGWRALIHKRVLGEDFSLHHL